MREDCRLTGRERMALDGIERLPRHEDRALARRLRTMRLRTPLRETAARFARRPRALFVTFLAGGTLALLLSATLTNSPPLVRVGAASWIITLLTATWPVASGGRARRRRRVA
ncbi:DUF3040 domain-containing protein [Actinacidiphila glaucinigra]|uniref:DUF3040 domain-containing protein n=1 Tax=Actinacidiphila glaucinigra TaxID=235986 RepID=UPI002E313EE8|nr:DUF3040 domain-containing protein [Actinacidiphila glaucinigra]